ncbi:anthranilate synthase component I family protein [Helicobacter cappadocius]|uniref:anthranilate synthase n=1 Tax=Helicobacter cappadocius TaxID=3063998 RepID=A0AA90TER2_9HELI|nr:MULTISPECIES: chorismate-binding protein [unclassified Helicobacter]MDO7252822.1 chorismate-binding protein [Helicobacter sp. faydin-H75]MDP2538865.1 chorismate-binding protein [Helicobacter sp. faydin-H76]
MFDFDSKQPAKIIVEKIISDSFTPLLVLENIQAKVLLESAYQETGKERYSLMMLESAFMVVKQKGRYFLKQADFELDLKEIDEDKKFLDWLEFFRNLAPIKPKELENIPLPLGGIGYLGYEFFEEIEDISLDKPAIVDTYECAFIFGRDFLIFDHLYDEAYIFGISYAKETQTFDLQNRVSQIVEKLHFLKPNPFPEKTYTAQTISEDKHEYYIQAVEYIKKEIYAGNLLQCVPSQSMQIKTDLPPLSAYRNLRHKNPSPYMFYFDFNDFKILGASPEVMVKSQDSTLTLRPIAGTRPRGETIAKDNKLQNELLADEKENAEHLMLVDLGRNDLGKIAIAGSVEVVEFKRIEKYSKVMHIVSEVKAKLDTQRYSSKDAIYATFPAGTVSGAPKIQAIKTIYKLEPHKRGVYSGLVGYFDRNGNLDSAISIRSAVYQNGIYYLQSGGGIVYDSESESEYLETKNKMLALIEAITQKQI